MNLKADSKQVSRIGDSLIFKLGNGKKAYLVNDDSDDDNKFAKYKYYGKMRDLDYFVLQVFYYEGSSHLIIDSAFRRYNFILSGFPVMSPNKKNIISGSCDLEAQYIFNGIKIYNANYPKE